MSADLSKSHFRIEVCNTCGGLVGWEEWRPGCCLGGVVCKREDGTQFVTVEAVKQRA